MELDIKCSAEFTRWPATGNSRLYDPLLNNFRDSYAVCTQYCVSLVAVEKIHTHFSGEKHGKLNTICQADSE